MTEEEILSLQLSSEKELMVEVVVRLEAIAQSLKRIARATEDLQRNAHEEMRRRPAW